MGSQFTEVHKMFYSFETAREDQEAADEAARNEAALISASENEGMDWDDWGDEADVYASIDAAEEAA